MNDETEKQLEYTIRRDGERDIKFTGIKLASTSSSNNTASSYYSGQVGRWAKLALYKTQGGKYVCESIGYTQWQGEHNRHKAAICETEQQVCEFFGNGWLAKDLFAEAGIDCSEEVE